MTEQEYSELEPLYQQAKIELPHRLSKISVSGVQRLYMIGYNRASRLLEHLAEHGHLAYDRLTGAYSRVPTPAEPR
jgi:DNA segregation ATPase FtsK/SpoIIIE-like protein